MNGDIIDGWQLKKRGSSKKKHTDFFRAILKMIENQQIKVVCLRGTIFLKNKSRDNRLDFCFYQFKLKSISQTNLSLPS
jgi:UDP-2,3-diacylglucosamine pyrophosphatase LpxH